MPPALVVAVAPAAMVPPLEALTVTTVPACETGLPKASVIRTTGCWARATPLAVVAEGWVVIRSCAAAAGVPVAVKLTGLPPSVPEVALRELLPAAVPRVQLPTVAIPAALVFWAGAVTEPPPPMTAKVTATPATGLPLRSVTRTLGGVVTAVFTVALWPLPAFAAMVAAGPAPSAIAVETSPVSPVAAKARV